MKLVKFYQKFMEKELLVDNEFKNLIDGCIKGDHKSQTLLYKKYYNIIEGTCLKMIKNKPLAEDLSQDIFIKLIKKLDKFNGYNFSQLSSWIVRLSKNHTIDFIRVRKITENIENVSLNLFTEIIDLADMDNNSEIMGNHIKKAISALPRQYRKVFELYHISNYSHQEIADELNLNVGTSKSNLFKAKKKLASALSQYNNKFN
jgi:RNA polymerase sigma factor (sigma-70 family)